MKKLIPKIIDLICFIGGSILLIYNLLDFKSSGGDFFGLGNGGNDSTYYYSKSNQILAAIGFGLIVLGFLIRSWRKENRNLNKK